MVINDGLAMLNDIAMLIGRIMSTSISMSNCLTMYNLYYIIDQMVIPNSIQ